MKKNMYLTIIWIVTIFCIVGGSCYHILGWGESYFGQFGLDFSSHKETYSNTLDAFDSISLDADLADIDIVVGDTYQLSYECSERVVPDFAVDGNTLRITQISKNTHFPMRNGNDNCEITVTVPKGMKISCISGGCDLGDVEIAEIEVDEIDIKCDLGEIVLERVVADSIVCTCNMGNCEINEADFNQLTVENDMGNIGVESRNPLSDYTLDLSVSMGDIEINGESYGSRVKQKGAKDKSINLSNSMGSIELEDD